VELSMRRVTRVHMPGLLARFMERARGREQRLVRGSIPGPLLLLSYPRGQAEAALEVESAYAHLLPSLPHAIRSTYEHVLQRMPALVVVLLRPTNLCGCLGHHHVKGTESRLTRRLRADLGDSVGEVDLAWEAIRGWQPMPLSAMAAEATGEQIGQLHFGAALLAVLLHEMEHLAFPERAEREVRTSSNEFYSVVMEELVRQEGGPDYGMSGI
jgi:hypothetical protein